MKSETTPTRTKQAIVMMLGLATTACGGQLGDRRDSGRIDATLPDGGGVDDTGPLADIGPVDGGVTTNDDATTLEMPDAYIDLGTDLAVVVRHTLPPSLGCGATTTAMVTMRNTGDTTWSNSGNYALQAVNSEDLFLTSGETVALGAEVPPGAEHTFDVTLSGPGPGNFPTQWHMVRGGVHTFGDVASSDVTVACDGPFRVFPVIIDGTFSMPEHEQRIASRDVSLLRLGHVITGDDAIDNAVLGGGAPDGGIWLSGSFHFEVDETGQNTAASWISVFGGEAYPVTGGIYGNGEIHMGSPAGVDISGLLKNGVVTGFVAEAGATVGFESDVWNRLPRADRNYARGIWHGAELSYVHGRMSGTGVLR